MANSQYFQRQSQLSSLACVVDLVPPTFAGLTSAVPKNNGAILLSWNLATDTSNPITYLLYIALGTVNAATLFQTANLVSIAPAGKTSQPIFSLADQTTYIIKDQQYTVGVRARDAAGNIDSNVVLSTVTALGSVDLATIYQDLASDLLDISISLAASAKGLGGGFAMDLTTAEFSAEISTTQLDMSIETEEVAP